MDRSCQYNMSGRLDDLSEAERQTGRSGWLLPRYKDIFPSFFLLRKTAIRSLLPSIGPSVLDAPWQPKPALRALTGLGR